MELVLDTATASGFEFKLMKGSTINESSNCGASSVMLTGDDHNPRKPSSF